MRRLPLLSVLVFVLLSASKLAALTCSQCLSAASAAKQNCTTQCMILPPGILRITCQTQCYNNYQTAVEGCCAEGQDCPSPGVCDSFGCSCGIVFETESEESELLPPCP